MFDGTAPPLAYQLPAEAYYHLVRTLRLTLPPPPGDSPDDLRRRDHAAIAAIAGLAPANAAEAKLAAQFVVASEQWTDCLRLAQLPETTPEWAAKCRAQALSMMRQANSALRLLLSTQQARQKLEADNVACDRLAWTEHVATALMAEALQYPAKSPAEVGAADAAAAPGAQPASPAEHPGTETSSPLPAREGTGEGEGFSFAAGLRATLPPDPLSQPAGKLLSRASGEAIEPAANRNPGESVMPGLDGNPIRNSELGPDPGISMAERRDCRVDPPVPVPAAAPPEPWAPSPGNDDRCVSDRPEDALAEAEHYAILYPERAALIRRIGGLPHDLSFGPPDDDVVQALIAGRGPAFAALDRAFADPGESRGCPVPPDQIRGCPGEGRRHGARA